MGSKYEFRIKEDIDRVGVKTYTVQKKLRSKYFKWYFTWKNVYGSCLRTSYNTLGEAQKLIHDHKVNEWNTNNLKVVKTSIIEDSEYTK